MRQLLPHADRGGWAWPDSGSVDCKPIGTGLLAGWKSIAVFFDETPEGTKVADQAAAIADCCDAHLIGIYGVMGHPGESPTDGFVRGKVAIREMLARHRAAEKSLAVNVKRRFASVVDRHAISSEFRLIGSEQAWNDPLIHSLHSDLIILGYPHSPGLSEPWFGEQLVLASGVPALFIPESWASTTVGQNILVAWNATREARRAIIDAMPLLKLAKSVTVLVVDAVETPDRFGAEPGADISLYLARHDVAVQLRQATSDGASLAHTILSYAALQGSDLVVVGAYSRGRLVELIFGGVTRDLLARASIPLLLSH